MESVEIGSQVCPRQLVGRTLRTIRILGLALALSVSWALVVPSPAWAHTGFESSNPGDGSTIRTDVAEIVLTFSGAAEPTGEGFVVLGPLGTVQRPDTISPGPDQKVWTLGFDPALTDGIVGVRWTVQAPDTHPISGSFSFNVDAPAGSELTGTDITPQPAQSDDVAAVQTDDMASDEMASDEIISSDAVNVTEEDLEQFLTQAEANAPNAEEVGAFGRLLGFVGTMLAVGGLVFATVVLRDHRRDIRSVLKAVRYSAVVVVVGTAIDLIAHLAASNNGWGNMLTVDGLESVALSAFGLAIGLRTAAGMMVFATARVLHRRTSITNSGRPAVERQLVGAAVTTANTEPDALMIGDPRLDQVGELTGSTPVTDGTSPHISVISPGLLTSVVVLLASFTFDGHTVTEGNRWITGAVDMIHVVAASIWAGGVVAFAVVLWRRHLRNERLNGLEMAVRFSVVAGAALAVAGLAGSVLAGIILDSISELWTTSWGRLLMAKFVTVAAAASLGAYNHFVVIPWMATHPDDDNRSVRLRNTVSGEAVLLIVVMSITAFLVGASSQS